jgi:hypothetical protein
MEANSRIFARKKKVSGRTGNQFDGDCGFGGELGGKSKVKRKKVKRRNRLPSLIIAWKIKEGGCNINK